MWAKFDFDGDDIEEKVTFWFQQAGYWLMVAKGDAGVYVSIGSELGSFLLDAKRIHLAIKDVNADGLPELLIAANSDDALAKVGVYGWRDEGFRELAVLSGQNLVYVFERGHFAMPYGSVGCYTFYEWKDGEYKSEDREDPLRRISVFGRLQ